jgi:hypothetical protein
MKEMYMFMKEKENTWMTRGIMVSINHKRELYLNSKCSNDSGLKDFYKLYCKILTRVIREAKQQQYSRKISTSKNKIKISKQTFMLQFHELLECRLS